MKKILLLMLPLMALCLASCEKNNGNEIDGLSGDDVIEFKDPNFLKTLLVVCDENIIWDTETGEQIPYIIDIDINKDGKITVNEAEQTKVIYILGEDGYPCPESRNITDMSEIKYFTSLVNLSCSLIPLTALDVSENKALEVLSSAYNQLTSLNLGNNTALRWLFCNNNKLTSLDVSGNTALTRLDCTGNQLTSLDLSKNTALTELYCSENQLTKIILNRNNRIDSSCIQDIISEYGNIIEYVD